MYKILIVDDEKEIRKAIAIYLDNKDYQIIEASDGKKAVDISDSENIDLILMDIMMPIMDGVEATKIIREKSNVPIIFLSAKSEDEDKINGLDIGADDYITKPFNPDELIARVRSNLRRYKILGDKESNKNQFQYEGLIVDDSKKEVTVDGDVVKLTPIEYKILFFLLKNERKVYTSSQIYEAIWNEMPYEVDNTIAVHIRHIREKIEINPRNPKYIQVVWGVGYKLGGK